LFKSIEGPVGNHSFIAVWTKKPLFEPDQMSLFHEKDKNVAIETLFNSIQNLSATDAKISRYEFEVVKKV